MYYICFQPWTTKLIQFNWISVHKLVLTEETQDLHMHVCPECYQCMASFVEVRCYSHPTRVCILTYMLHFKSCLASRNFEECVSCHIHKAVGRFTRTACVLIRCWTPSQLPVNRELTLNWISRNVNGSVPNSNFLTRVLIFRKKWNTFAHLHSLKWESFLSLQ